MRASRATPSAAGDSVLKRLHPSPSRNPLPSSTGRRMVRSQSMPDGTLPLRANFPAAAVGFALYGPAEIPTPEDLANFLLIHGCDPSELPALGGKTLNDLFAEVAAGEVRLGLQLIVRHVVSAAVSIRVPTLP